MKAQTTKLLLFAAFAALPLTLTANAQTAATPAPVPAKSEYQKARDSYIAGQKSGIIDANGFWRPTPAGMQGLPPWLKSEAAYLEHKKALAAKRREKAGKLNSGGLKSGGL